jgi:hypothetical protein
VKRQHGEWRLPRMEAGRGDVDIGWGGGWLGDRMSYKIGVPEMGKRGFSNPEEVH